MKKTVILLLLLVLALTGIFLFFSNKQKTPATVIENEAQEKDQEESLPETGQFEEQEDTTSLFVSGWLPYWAKNDGADSLEGNLEIFDEINPFSFQVNTEGKLVDAVGIEKLPWTELIQDSKTSGTQIIPTLIWTDSDAMHKIFGDNNLLQSHIARIIELLEKYDFPGVDIDYEGKDVADKDLFTNFIQLLAKELRTKDKKLSCTIEARTMDDPPEGFDGVRAMSYANDIPALSESCDEIRVMAYDQVFQQYRANTFQTNTSEPFAPNAAINWVEEVVQYMLQYIPQEKLVLGVPTYGWEFQINKIENGFEYTRYRSIGFPDAKELAESNKIETTRNQGGELDFVYSAKDGKQHIVNFSDAKAIKQKIELTKKYQLKGISIFKIDGLTDPEMFSVLEEETLR